MSDRNGEPDKFVLVEDLADWAKDMRERGCRYMSGLELLAELDKFVAGNMHEF